MQLVLNLSNFLVLIYGSFSDFSVETFEVAFSCSSCIDINNNLLCFFKWQYSILYSLYFIAFLHYSIVLDNKWLFISNPSETNLYSI